MKKNDVLDALSEAIEATISNFINKDVYYFIAPYLTQGRVNIDCPFFADNRITLQDGWGASFGGLYPDRFLYPDAGMFPSTFDGNDLTYTNISEDLKTISYLAPFQRARVAYNPKNIDYYLRTLGHITYDETAMDILCFEGGKCGDDTKHIGYKEWINLP